MISIAMLALELSTAVSAQGATPQPVQAELVGVTERRPVVASADGTGYQRVEIAYRNTGSTPIALRSCAADARLAAFHPAVGGETDSATAFGVGSSGSGNWSGGCRETALPPGQPVTLAYYIRGAGRGRGPRQLTIDTSAGRFVVDGQGQPWFGRARQR